MNLLIIIVYIDLHNCTNVNNVVVVYIVYIFYYSKKIDNMSSLIRDGFLNK